ncbi:hypothetical protein ALQ36_103580 [Pseudomonas syringae pv. primulae]|uniref:Uncharacterized protein n=1 Tax=Pseudomonas syringae pv. primulae TaxID=251707 RepID=A0A3M3Y815_9PSED|nr:hypothetical protein ALQ36_103580 [Pseudomonas syringae pv. primulae]RMU37738.1 hypothetical protein ALP30_104127 [Pseudomonas syringae pv. primulae]
MQVTANEIKAIIKRVAKWNWLEKIVGQRVYVKCQLMISRYVFLISRAQFRKALINHQNRQR